MNRSIPANTVSAMTTNHTFLPCCSSSRAFPDHALVFSRPANRMKFENHENGSPPRASAKRASVASNSDPISTSRIRPREAKLFYAVKAGVFSRIQEINAEHPLVFYSESRVRRSLLRGIPRLIARATTPDGGPLRYRVTHRAERWRADKGPKLQQRVAEGDAKLSI